MKTIECPGCGAVVGAYPYTCPHCGYPLREDYMVGKKYTRNSDYDADSDDFDYPWCDRLYFKQTEDSYDYQRSGTGVFIFEERCQEITYYR